MKKLRWQLLVVLLALIAIAVLLFSQFQITLPGEEIVEEPISGGIYSEALIGSFGRLNPLLDIHNQVDYDLDRLIYSGLIRFNDRGLPLGDLADSWGISQDGKTYNFSIRPNAVWHDGTPVTSNDILFTVNLIKDPLAPIPEDYKIFWGDIEIEALDDKTLQFRLPEAFSPFLDYLTFGILPEHLLRGLTAEELIDAPFNLKPIGSGPFRFEAFEIVDGEVTAVELTSFDDYYGEAPFINQAIFRYYPNETAAYNAYEQGDVLGISQFTDDTLIKALKNENLKIFTSRLPKLNIIYLNLGNPELSFFQEEEVRKALLIGINRRWIIDRILHGQAILAKGPIFPESWAFYEGIQEIPYDRERAIEILKDAGYLIPADGGNVRVKDGMPLSFEMVCPDEEYYTEIAHYIQENWAAIGVELSINPIPYQELIDNFLTPRTYQAALVEINLARSPDPDPYPFWHQTQATGGQNFSQWDDRQVSEYLEQARVVDDLNERAKRYRNFQVRYMDEQPALELFFPVYSFGIDEQVMGVSMGPIYDLSDRFNTITSWYMVTASTEQTEVTPSSEESE